jgi:GGDEF domain-containing protein
LPNTSAEQVLLIAERLQGRFAQEDFDSEEDLRLNLGLVTCSPQSLKSTHTAQTTSAIDEFLACLDRSLTEAKTQEGRFVLQAYSV